MKTGLNLPQGLIDAATAVLAEGVVTPGTKEHMIHALHEYHTGSTMPMPYHFHSMKIDDDGTHHYLLVHKHYTQKDGAKNSEGAERQVHHLTIKSIHDHKSEGNKLTRCNPGQCVHDVKHIGRVA